MRIAKDRLTEDIIVALGAGVFIVIISPLILHTLVLEVKSRNAKVLDHTTDELESLIEKARALVAELESIS